MTIEKYHIRLERIKHDDIELLRIWRNDEKIRKHMFYTNEITPAMQESWFQSINNNDNYYFIIYYQNKAIGLINLSSIDWENQSAFAGLFIFDDTFLATDAPVRASLCLLDYFFEEMHFQRIFAKVKENNKVAHKYNTALGFKRSKKIEQSRGFEYILTKDDYFEKTKLFRKLANRV